MICSGQWVLVDLIRIILTTSVQWNRTSDYCQWIEITILPIVLFLVPRIIQIVQFFIWPCGIRFIAPTCNNIDQNIKASRREQQALNYPFMQKRRLLWWWWHRRRQRPQKLRVVVIVGIAFRSHLISAFFRWTISQSVLEQEKEEEALFSKSPQL